MGRHLGGEHSRQRDSVGDTRLQGDGWGGVGQDGQGLLVTGGAGDWILRVLPSPWRFRRGWRNLLWNSQPPSPASKEQRPQLEGGIRASLRPFSQAPESAVWGERVSYKPLPRGPQSINPGLLSLNKHI